MPAATLEPEQVPVVEQFWVALIVVVIAALFSEALVRVWISAASPLKRTIPN